RQRSTVPKVCTADFIPRHTHRQDADAAISTNSSRLNRAADFGKMWRWLRQGFRENTVCHPLCHCFQESTDDSKRTSHHQKCATEFASAHSFNPVSPDTRSPAPPPP